MRKRFLAAAISSLLLSAGVSHAGTYAVGDLTALGDGGYGASVSFAAGSFSDVFNFSISGGASDFAGYFSKVSVRANQELSSYSALMVGPGNFSQAWTPSISTGPIVQSLSYEGTLAAGAYTLTFNATAPKNGNYSVSLSAAPIPEPESYAMLLAGLGLIGLMARRRI